MPFLKNVKKTICNFFRQRVKSSENWSLFYYYFEQDHAKPNLIWNFRTRQELQDSLQLEMEQFSQDRELAGGQLISWNHQEFTATYPSLSDEIKIGKGFYRAGGLAELSRQWTSLSMDGTAIFNLPT